MPLTRDFKETVKRRAERDPEFRIGLLQDAIEALFNNDLDTGKVMLRAYVNATIGFNKLAADLGKEPKTLMQMLSSKGNPGTQSLFSIIGYLKQMEGVEFKLTVGKVDNAKVDTTT